MVSHLASRRIETRRRQLGQGGALSVGAVVGWIAAIGALVGIIYIVNQRTDAVMANNVASEMKALKTAGDSYLNHYAVEIDQSGVLTPGGKALVIPFGRTSPSGAVPPGPSLPTGGALPSVQGAGFLPQTFIDKDPFGQSHVLVISETSASSYNALIVSVGGLAQNNTMLGDIVNRFPGTGGLVPTATGASPGSGTIEGHDRSWSIPVNQLAIGGGGSVAQPGHYAVLLANQFNPSQLALSHYLSRYTNSPSNGMTTSVEMNGNPVEGTSSVSTSDGGSIGGGGAPNTIALSNSNVTAAGSLSVQGNFSDTGNVTIAGVDSLGSLAAQNATVSGNLSAGSVAGSSNAGESLSLGHATLNCGSSGTPQAACIGSSTSNTMSVSQMGTATAPVPSVNVASSTLAAQTLSAGTASISSSGFSGSTGNLTVSQAHAVGAGSHVFAQHVVPQYSGAFAGQPCANPGEYAQGRFQNPAGQVETAELFCEASGSSNGAQHVWGGAVAGGYAIQGGAKQPTVVNATLRTTCLAPHPLQGGGLSALCSTTLIYQTPPTPGEYIKLNITGAHAGGYPCVGCTIVYSSPWTEIGYAASGQPTEFYVSSNPNFFGSGLGLVTPGAGDSLSSTTFYQGAVGVYGAQIFPSYVDPGVPALGYPPFTVPAEQFPPPIPTHAVSGG